MDSQPWQHREFARIRLYVEDDLVPGARVALGDDQSHYLLHVMRRASGDGVRLFNGRDGEWAAAIRTTSRRSVELECGQRLRPQDRPRDVALAFAPIKKAPLGYLVEKATELGAARLQPVITAYTQVHELNLDRLRRHAIEAAEQCWRMSIPELAGPIPLMAFLDRMPQSRLLYCDERLAGSAASPVETLSRSSPGFEPWTILIGPEGGFSPEERDALDALESAVPISLGPRVVRAETAAVMALTLWQSVLGDLGPGRH